MNVTVEEAGDMLCCGPEEAGRWRIDDDGERRRYCAALACMAWRWHGYRGGDGKWVKITAGRLYADALVIGYCGLAGNPS